jgi:hypothetical protein
VVGRVPVLREDDVFEQWRDAMDGLDHGITIANGKRSAGAEVVLHVDDDENVVAVEPHLFSRAENVTGTFILSKWNPLNRRVATRERSGEKHFDAVGHQQVNILGSKPFI